MWRGMIRAEAAKRPISERSTFALPGFTGLTPWGVRIPTAAFGCSISGLQRVHVAISLEVCGG